jgi:hypothetical protein
VHDAVLCAEVGVPAVVVVTEPFEHLARNTAANFGVPDFPILVVEHPIFTRDESWVADTAARLADLISQGSLVVIEEHG